MTLAGFEPETPGWQAKVLTTTPKISRYYLVNKLLYLNLVHKNGYIFITANSIVESDRAYSGLLITVFKSFENKTLTRLDSNHWISIKVSIRKCFYMIDYLIVPLPHTDCAAHTIYNLHYTNLHHFPEDIVDRIMLHDFHTKLFELKKITCRYYRL